MTSIITFFGPKATLPMVFVIMSVAPIAVWHYAHVVKLVVESLLREND